jgi:hypothetical protein
MSWEMHQCVILLVAAHETVWVEECEGTTFNMMPFVYFKTESPKTPPLFFGHNVFART